MWLHAHWLERASETVLEEAGDPHELFLVDDCEDQHVSDIVRKVRCVLQTVVVIILLFLPLPYIISCYVSFVPSTFHSFPLPFILSFYLSMKGSKITLNFLLSGNGHRKNSFTNLVRRWRSQSQPRRSSRRNQRRRRQRQDFFLSEMVRSESRSVRGSPYLATRSGAEEAVRVGLLRWMLLDADRGRSIRTSSRSGRPNGIIRIRQYRHRIRVYRIR